MADEADIAQLAQERILQSQIAQRKPVVDIGPRGYCYNPYCEAAFDSDSLKLFCDAECAKKYDLAKKRGLL